MCLLYNKHRWQLFRRHILRETAVNGRRGSRGRKSRGAGQQALKQGEAYHDTFLRKVFSHNHTPLSVLQRLLTVRLLALYIKK